MHRIMQGNGIIDVKQGKRTVVCYAHAVCMTFTTDGFLTSEDLLRARMRRSLWFGGQEEMR